VKSGGYRHLYKHRAALEVVRSDPKRNKLSLMIVFPSKAREKLRAVNSSHFPRSRNVLKTSSQHFIQIKFPDGTYTKGSGRCTFSPVRVPSASKKKEVFAITA
jgi:hypothetical protein